MIVLIPNDFLNTCKVSERIFCCRNVFKDLFIPWWEATIEKGSKRVFWLEVLGVGVLKCFLFNVFLVYDCLQHIGEFCKSLSCTKLFTEQVYPSWLRSNKWKCVEIYMQAELSGNCFSDQYFHGIRIIDIIKLLKSLKWCQIKGSKCNIEVHINKRSIHKKY